MYAVIEARDAVFSDVEENVRDERSGKMKFARYTLYTCKRLHEICLHQKVEMLQRKIVEDLQISEILD